MKINIELLAGIVISFGFGILIQAFISKTNGIYTATEFGEYTGGGVATLFTLGGILLFAHALKLQREDINAAILSRDESNENSARMSKIQLINGRIQAHVTMLDIKKMDAQSNTKSLAMIEVNVASLEISLKDIMDELKVESSRRH